MGKTRTFGWKLALGFGAMVVVACALAIGAMTALQTVAKGSEEVLSVDARNLILAAKLDSAIESKSTAFRGYLLLRDDHNLDVREAAEKEVTDTLRTLQSRASDGEAARLLADIERSEAEHQRTTDAVVELSRTESSAQAIARAYEEQVLPKRRDLHAAVEAFVAHEELLLDQRSRAAKATASGATSALGAGAIAALALAVGIAWVLTRTLARQIGGAVQHVQSSSSELQTAANQQASGAKEQSTAISQISTTMSELLATSRQIAESAQRVAHIATDTAKAARTGEQITGRTGDSIGAIKKQVDLIVSHMLDLGRKSQQIGGILEIINELSEQTNILAINATIEAAGAGESGKRFAVVADEIRKLADRVNGSTREIRGLIDEVRSAVNATVMTTEGGSKAVDAGTRQFAEVAVALQQIVSSVTTTTEASREIELSTKQQATAVEQIKVAITNVAQATLETEASASQTLQTASQLTSLSRDLMRLVQPQASAQRP